MDLKRYLAATASKDKWQRIGAHRRAGILAPLFSVYSKKSVGIADMDDLKLLVDFATKTGNSILQLLPMNELGSLFCPYDSVSSFALEPAYICLERFDAAGTKSLKSRIDAAREKFSPKGGYVNYAVKSQKLDILREIFSGEKNKSLKGLDDFIKENGYWVRDFALYKVLKERHGGNPWYEWEVNYKEREARALEDFRRTYQEEIDFQIWLQWHLYEQFREVKRYAASKKVLLKGDLPVLVSKDSADVWAHQEFFNLDLAAGAPPDMYCAKGQRWGMPTYNWQNIAEDGFRYLKAKLKYAENFYDILRVDHVVGLFRIWSMPYSDPTKNMGLNGFFDPPDESVWEAHGKTILSIMLKGTKMLLAAEDLGMIPKACPATLKKLGIPGNDVQRWVKDWEVKHDFLPPEKYRPLSVSMLSTHDTTNWPAWWENEAGTADEGLFIRKCASGGIDYNYVKEKLFDPVLSKHGRLRWRDEIDSVGTFASILGKPEGEIKDFIEIYENTFREKERLWKHLGMKGTMREEADRELVSSALEVTLASSSIFCINLIFDLLYLTDILKGDPYKYRVNTPGTISDRNWSLVTPLPLEDLLRHDFCVKLERMARASGRI
jgi:4-alpha-glucanotransferase